MIIPHVLDFWAIARDVTPRDTVRVKIALIIENRPSAFKTLKGYLADIDPEIECVQFQTFNELAYWFRYSFIPDHESLKKLRSQLQQDQQDPSSSEGEAEEKESLAASSADTQAHSDDKNKKTSKSKDGEEDESAEEETNLTIVPNYNFRALREGDEVVLLISNHRIFGAKHKPLLVKMGAFLKAKGFLGEDKKTLPALFTVSETDETFVIRDYLEPYINNILFRPFDRLVCQAKILWALYGKEAISKMELYKEAATDLIEMRKDIQTLELSETGFRVLSSRPLKEGMFAKYYGTEFFNNNPKDGVFGIIRSSEPSSQYPDQHEVELKFLGIDSKQIRAIRTKLEEITDSYAKEEPVPRTKGSPVGIVLLLEDKTISHQIKEQLEESFENVDIKVFGNFVDFLLNIDPEHGAQELLAQQQGEEQEEQIFEFHYNLESDVFMGTEPEVTEANIFGIPKNQLATLKGYLLQQLPPDNRPDLLSFWAQGQPEAVYTMKLTVDGVSSFISLCDRQVDGPTLKFKLRRASLEEVTAYMAGQSKLPQSIGAVFVSERMANYRDSEYWLGLKEKMIGAGFHSENELAFIRVAESAIKDQQIAERSSAFDETLVTIVDHRYLTLRVPQMVRGLKYKREKPIELKAEFKTTVQAATLVSELQVNEVNIILSYKRPIDIGKFRYFSFWDKKTGQMEVFLSKCVDAEKDPDNKGRYLNYFLLYGLTDPENAFLRNWMIEQYRLAKGSKEKGA